jgi:hypothetical protein
MTSRPRHLFGVTIRNRRGRGQDRVSGVPLAPGADHQLLSGCREDVPRKGNGELEVGRRTIVLDASVLLDKNLSVFR